MGRIRDISEGLWSGALDPAQNHPFAPLMDVETVARRTTFVSSFANATAFDTDEGLVLVDTGSFLLAGQVHAAVRGVSRQPLHTAVYTHGHVDHCFGVELYEAEGTRARVIGHERVPQRFARYALTRGYNACINTRQFQMATAWPNRFRLPDVTYAASLDVTVGGETFELRHALGETDDATWVWVPSRAVVCVGDLFIWATPNAGNPQKVQRYPREWAHALRILAELPAEVMCPGHGPPIFGRHRVQHALSDTAELLESLVEQTLALMDEGARLDAILGAVKAPAHLLERPYLAEARRSSECTRGQRRSVARLPSRRDRVACRAGGRGHRPDPIERLCGACRCGDIPDGARSVPCSFVGAVLNFREPHETKADRGTRPAQATRRRNQPFA